MFVFAVVLLNWEVFDLAGVGYIHGVWGYYC